MSSLHESLDGLRDCLCDGRLAGITKEKSWTNFHHLVPTLQVPGVTANVSSFIALKVFSSMVLRKWPKESEKPIVGTELTESDNDVLVYIGGAIVHKLKSRYTDPTKQNLIVMLACGSDDPCACFSKLTKTKDRGGLTYIKQNALEMLKKMEKLFMSKVNDGQIKEKFVSDCKQLIEDDFLFCLYESGDFSKSDDENVVAVMSDVINLFF